MINEFSLSVDVLSCFLRLKMMGICHRSRLQHLHTFAKHLGSRFETHNFHFSWLELRQTKCFIGVKESLVCNSMTSAAACSGLSVSWCITLKTTCDTFSSLWLSSQVGARTLELSFYFEDDQPIIRSIISSSLLPWAVKKRWN